VGIEDITPIAVHFGDEVPADDTERNSLPAVIDGSGNGVVDIADVTPIAQNFGIEVADYIVEEEQFSEVEAVPVGEATGAETGRAVFTHIFTPGEYSYFRVTARDGAGSTEEPSNTVGIALQILSVAPTEVKEGTVVTFGAEVLGAGPLSYEWDFGGGAQYEAYTEPSPRVVLTRETGEFPASLTVTGPTGADTYPFTLSKLAREWKYEVVLERTSEYSLNISDLAGNGGEVHLLIGVWEGATGAQYAKYLLEGEIGEWEIVEIPYWGAFGVSPQGAVGVLFYSGAIFNLDLNFAEKTANTWDTASIESGVFFAASNFIYSGDGTPFALYIFTYWVPERTDELRFARRISSEWLNGVIDDAGGPGGAVQQPIIMRVDPYGNPVVAYRAIVDDRKELRLARWNPASGEWNIQVVLPHLGDDFDFAFDAEGHPSFAYSGQGTTEESEAIHFMRKDGELWSDTIVAEWSSDAASLKFTRLAYDPLNQPILVSDNSRGSANLWWFSGDSWDTCEIESGLYITQMHIAVRADGTPFVAYCAHEDWDDSPREVVLVSYE